MIKIFTKNEAYDSILQRVPPDDMPVSASLLDGIEAFFGQPLTPEQAVRQILREVREDGDIALQKWSAKLDGLDTGSFHVDREVIKKPLQQSKVRSGKH